MTLHPPLSSARNPSCPSGPSFPSLGNPESDHPHPGKVCVSSTRNLEAFTMGRTGFPVLYILLSLAWTQLGNAQGQKDCSSNYQLSPGAIAAVVLGDLLLTLLLALAVYYMASCIHRRQAANSGDMKKKSELESPYQELQGHKLDIYSDLRSPGVNYR